MIHAARFFSILFLLLLAACGGQGTLESPPPSPRPEDPNATALPPGEPAEEPVNPYAPGKGDESLTRDEVLIDDQQILVLESFPPQFRLQVIGFLPGDCHDLRVVVDEPSAQDEIHVQIYSLFDPERDCSQERKPFQVSISLGTNFMGTEYTVFLNGEQIGEIHPIPQVIQLTPGILPVTPVP